MKKAFTQKNITALLLAAVMAFSTAACGKGKDKAQEPDAPIEAQGEAAETPVQAEPVPTLQEALLTARDEPELKAPAAILIEETTGTILYEKNGREKMYPASMTKLVTALVAMDYYRPEELITIGQEVNEISWDSSRAGHRVGETMTLKNIIRGLIIPSGNDSANVIAAAVAKRAENDQSLNFRQCEQIFTELMNRKAQELGAVNSHFSNAHGYHDENHYSCAYDMALFSREFMKNSTLKEVAGEKSFSGNGADNMFSEEEGMKTQDYLWFSHNLLITDGEYRYEYATGIKTGFTDEAGDCVAAAARKEGETLIAIVFDSADPNRWKDAESLFEYGYNGYSRMELCRAGAVIEEAPLTKHDKTKGDTVPVVYQEGLATYLPPLEEGALSAEVTYDETRTETDKEGNRVLKAPLAKGEQVGTVAIRIDGETVWEGGALAGRDIAKGTVLSSIKAFAGDFVQDLFSVKGLLGLALGIAVICLIVLIIRLIGGRRRKRRKTRGYTFSASARKSMGGGRRRRF